MDRNERIEMIEQAREHIRSAISLIREATEDLDEFELIRRTLLADLEIMIGEGEWLHNTVTLSDCIERLPL